MNYIIHITLIKFISAFEIRVYLSIFYFSMVNFDGTDNFPTRPNETYGLGKLYSSFMNLEILGSRIAEPPEV